MRTRRELPDLVKVKRPWPASCYDIELHLVHNASEFGLASPRVGEVVKVGSKWDATVRLDFSSGVLVRRFLRGMHNMRTAIQAMSDVIALLVDEHEAHLIQATILAAQARADEDVRKQDPEQPYVFIWPLGVQRRITGTNEELGGELHAIRPYMGRGLGSLREFDINAYVARMIEHELIRRAEVDENMEVEL